MKLKKTITSKPFIAGVLAVMCVGILGTCLLLQNNKQDEFVPEQSSPVAPVESWSENESTAVTDKEAGMSDGKDNAATEEYPKVAESSEGQTVIDFTNPEPAKTETPPAPEGKTIKEDTGPSHPVQKSPETTAPPPETEKPTSPPAGGKPGQVYDPVFGWITPSDVQQEVIDGEGDPNKMVGTMD